MHESKEIFVQRKKKNFLLCVQINQKRCWLFVCLLILDEFIVVESFQHEKFEVCVCVSKCLNQFTKRKTIQTKMMEIKNQRPQINVKQCIEEYGIKMFSKKKQINDNDKQE